MNKTLTPKDLESYSSVELDILVQSIKRVQDDRRAELIEQFYNGMPIAILDTETDNWVPVFVYKANKASVKFIHALTEERLPNTNRIFDMGAKAIDIYIEANELVEMSSYHTLKSAFQLWCVSKRDMEANR